MKTCRGAESRQKHALFADEECGQLDALATWSGEHDGWMHMTAHGTLRGVNTSVMHHHERSELVSFIMYHEPRIHVAPVLKHIVVPGHQFDKTWLCERPGSEVAPGMVMRTVEQVSENEQPFGSE